MAGKLGVVLVGGDRCLNIIRTEDVEHQDKVSTKQERTQENSSFDKKVRESISYLLITCCGPGGVTIAWSSGTRRGQL